MSRNICIIMCKAPELGRVKTRLAADIGSDSALRVYTQLLQITLRAATSSAWDTVIALDGDPTCMPPHPHRTIEQRGADLGTRICNAMHDAGTFDQCVVIGADAPLLTQQHLAEAFHALSSHGIVIGPALDGGYWLIGMHRILAELFTNIPWSTHDVLPRTLERCHQLEQTVMLLEPLSDIDVLGDLDRHPEFVY